MPVIQERNSEAQLLGSVDHLYFTDRNFCFEAYATVSNSFTSTEVQPFDTVKFNTAPEVFDWDGSILTLPDPGLYLFMCRIAMQGGSGNAEAAFFLEEDPDTAVFSTSSGSTTYVGMPANIRQSGQMSTLVWTSFNYRFRISLLRTVGAANIETVGNPVLSVIRLFKN